MSLQRSVDDWFLGFHTRAVRPKATSGIGIGKSRQSAKPLKPGSGLANLRAAALKHPEVMVKIPRRRNPHTKGMNGIRNHLDYVSRNGEVTLETQSGEKLQGKAAVKQLQQDWKNLGIPEHSKHKEYLSIVLSMPAGTDPDAVLKAAGNFAAEQFEDHQYVFALHHESDRPGEPAHPHVHLCVLMRDAFGHRMNPRKSDLFEWRVRFAEKLREEGVECAATRRQHRGKTQKPENNTLIAIRRRGEVSHVHRQQAEALITALKNNDRPKHLFLKEAMRSRSIITAEYGLIAKELYKMGHKTEARIVSRLTKEVSGKDFNTRAQEAYDRIAGQHLTPAAPQITAGGPDQQERER